MNKHIELVKRWIADNDSVSNEELTDNSVAAYTAWVNAKVYADAGGTARFAADAADHAASAARAAASSGSYAADAAYDSAYDAADGADYWVKRYEELTK